MVPSPRSARLPPLPNVAVAATLLVLALAADTVSGCKCFLDVMEESCCSNGPERIDCSELHGPFVGETLLVPADCLYVSGSGRLTAKRDCTCGLSTLEIVLIVVGVAILIVIAVTVGVVCHRRRRGRAVAAEAAAARARHQPQTQYGQYPQQLYVAAYPQQRQQYQPAEQAEDFVMTNFRTPPPAYPHQQESPQ